MGQHTTTDPGKYRKTKALAGLAAAAGIAIALTGHHGGGKAPAATTPAPAPTTAPTAPPPWRPYRPRPPRPAPPRR
jgi:hypothetical protein